MNEREKEWVEAARRGDADAFESLLHAYEKRVMALALRMCGSPEDAAEAAQDAFLAAWQGLPFFRGESSFSTWLYRLASNACVDRLRRERRHRDAAGPSLDDGEAAPPLANSAPGPQELAERGELRERIEAGLAVMTPEHREVLILREIHQLSYDEIAESLDLDLGTVKSRLNRGRKQLRNFLAQAGNFSDARPSKGTERGAANENM